MDLLTEDNKERMEQMSQDFRGYNKDGVKITINPVMADIHGIEKITMNIEIISPTITEDIVNEKLKVISMDLQSKGYGDLNITFSIRSVTYVPKDLKTSKNLNLEIDVLQRQPHQIKENLKNGYHSIQDVLMGNVDMKIETDVIPKVDENTSEWIRILKKKCITVYEVLKTGSVNGVSYTLKPYYSEFPDPVVVYHESTVKSGEVISRKNFTPGLSLTVTKIGDPSKMEEVKNGLHEKFKKLGVHVILHEGDSLFF